MQPGSVLHIQGVAELGGAEISLLRLERSLVNSGWRIVVACPAEGQVSQRTRALGISTQIVPMCPRYKRHSVEFARTVIRLAKLIKSVNPDLVHVNSFNAPEFGVLASKLARKPCIYHVRDFYDHLTSMRRLVFHLADRLICVSDAVVDKTMALGFDRSRLNKIYNGLDIGEYYPKEVEVPPVSIEIDEQPALGNMLISLRNTVIKKAFGLNYDRNKIHKIYCGVDLDVYYPQNISIYPKKRVGIFSRLSPDKGQDVFLRAAHLVTASTSGVEYIVGGIAVHSHYPEYVSTLHTLVADLQLSEQVNFTGFVDNVPEFINSLDVVVLASRSEPLGLVVLEAMACEKPVVVTRSGGPQEMVDDGVDGLIVDVDDHVAMANAIRFMLNNPKQAQEMGKRGRAKVVKQFGVDSHANAIQQVYEEIIFSA